ncbi:MAG TPA: hypothetical protein VI140_02660 [Oxalicibacterium sp.]
MMKTSLLFPSKFRRSRATARLALATAVLATTSFFAGAENVRSYGIDQQQQDIHARIEQGIAYGLITQDEADELSRRESSIQQRAAGFRRDGTLTPQERDQLRRDLDALHAGVERSLRNTRMKGSPDGYLPDLAGRATQIGKRIDYGISSGLITRTEAQRLMQRETDIYHREAAFRVDGQITQPEKDMLQHDLEALNRDVERLLKNVRTRR